MSTGEMVNKWPKWKTLLCYIFELGEERSTLAERLNREECLSNRVDLCKTKSAEEETLEVSPLIE